MKQTQHLIGCMVTDKRPRNEGLHVHVRTESNSLTAEQRRKIREGLTALIAETLGD